MGLPETILRGIYAYGFERPSDIQTKAIVPIKEGRDVLAQARSGTGKTGTFCIGSLSKVNPEIKKTQVLVLVHVRELATQIKNVATALSEYMGINCYCATGGTPLREDLKAIEKGAQFIVGTPGRVFDLMNRNALSREHIKVLVLDEADQMLEDRLRSRLCAFFKWVFRRIVRLHSSLRRCPKLL
jgi:translation initiation factor 4A